MAYNPGDIVYMNYGEIPVIHHCRIVLATVDDSSHDYVILTPDHDIYTEKLHISNTDIVGITPGDAAGVIPAGLAAANIYGFAPLTAAQLAQFMQEGRREAVDERNRRGLGAAAVAGGQVWVLAEMMTGKKVGEQVTPPPGTPTLGSYGLMTLTDSDGVSRTVLIKQLGVDELDAFCEQRVQLARETEAIAGEDRSASDDIRTLSVQYNMNGERKRSFKETVGEMIQVEMEDFPYEVRTCHEYLQAVSSVAESCFSQHLAWVQQSGIPSGSRAIYEDEVLSQILDVAISYDALCVSNLASFELLVRRKQLLAEAHSYNPASPSYEGSDYWMGSRYKHGGAIVVPRLTEHVSKKLQADSQIMKERRKLEEAKGRGRGKGGPPKPGSQGGRGGGSES